MNDELRPFLRQQEEKDIDFFKRRLKIIITIAVVDFIAVIMR